MLMFKRAVLAFALMAAHALGMAQAERPLTAEVAPGGWMVQGRLALGSSEAARNMDPFDEACARTDWLRFEKLPLFGLPTRMNACNTCLLMERAAR